MSYDVITAIRCIVKLQSNHCCTTRVNNGAFIHSYQISTSNIPQALLKQKWCLQEHVVRSYAWEGVIRVPQKEWQICQFPKVVVLRLHKSQRLSEVKAFQMEVAEKILASSWGACENKYQRPNSALLHHPTFGLAPKTSAFPAATRLEGVQL